MSKRVVVAGVVWVVVTVLAFRVDPILGACVAIFAGAGAVVVGMAGNWDSHPGFEQRELARAGRRAAKKARNWDKNSDTRERDRARYAAHRAKQEARARAAEAQRAPKDRPAGERDDREAS